MEQLVNILGAVASIAGAGLSVYFEHKAKKHALLAKTYKEQVIKNQKTTRLAILYEKAKSVQKGFGKYRIADGNKSLTGTNQRQDSASLSDFLFLFSEEKDLISKLTTMDPQVFQSNLNNVLSDFSQSTTNRKCTEYGKRISTELEFIIHKLRNGIDQSNEQT